MKPSHAHVTRLTRQRPFSFARARPQAGQAGMVFLPSYPMIKLWLTAIGYLYIHGAWTMVTVSFHRLLW
jgi:hypothetical protein